MPNWVHNKMSIETSENKIKEIKDTVTEIGEHEGIEGYSIAKNLYPLPYDLTYVAGTGDTVQYFLLQDKIVKPPKMDEEYFKILKGELEPRWKVRELTTGEKQSLIEQYGATNWYDWNVKNYGTKWGDVDTELVVNHEDYLEFQFDSAWSPPFKLAENISKDYDAKVVLKYNSIENMDKGKIIFKSGRLTYQLWEELDMDFRQVRTKAT